MMRQQLHNALEPWARLYAQAERRLSDMSDAELVVLKEAVATASPSNCWYAKFRVSRVLAPLVESELHDRARKEKEICETT